MAKLQDVTKSRLRRFLDDMATLDYTLSVPTFEIIHPDLIKLEWRHTDNNYLIVWLTSQNVPMVDLVHGDKLIVKQGVLSMDNIRLLLNNMSNPPISYGKTSVSAWKSFNKSIGFNED